MKKGNMGLSVITGVIVGAGIMTKILLGIISKTQNLASKHLALFLMMN